MMIIDKTFKYIFKLFSLSSIVILLFHQNMQAQAFMGPHLSQYDPLKVTYFNPGALTNSDLRWQINILSTDFTVGNNMVKTASLKGIFKEFNPWSFFKINMDGERKYLNLHSDIRGPSFLINFGKNSIAVGSRIKEVSSINDLNEDLAYALFNYYDDFLSYPDLKNERFSVSINAYAEYNIAFARKIINGEKHQLSAGINFKLLDKILYSTIDGRKINLDKIESITHRSVNVHHSELDFIISDDLHGRKLKHDWSPDGWAIDAGVEYTYKASRLTKGYSFKVGVALNDFGTLKQINGSNSFYFKGNNQYVPLNDIDIDEVSFENIGKTLDSLGTRTFTGGKNNIVLPSTLHTYIDLRVLPKFYVYGGIQINPYDFKKRVGLANLPNQFTLVPRFETKLISVYVPISWDRYNEFTGGAGIRFNQFSLGSSNIISSIIKNKYTGINLYASFSFGGKRRVKKV
ncbi:MAG: DUF5723 family protein [Chitinophagales bacterium]|nr:DUF5723 family protein [Chitinophagales bacterium]